jgi:hypothetical protein
MKLRQHRRSVQRRMAAAPDHWTRERLLYLGHQWTRRDLRALAKKKAPALVFNVIPRLPGRTTLLEQLRQAPPATRRR